MPFILITGGCRSGKSSYAESTAKHYSANCLYIATAEVRDDEMRARVMRHRETRGAGWRLHECSCADAAELWRHLPSLAQPGEAVLFDCLTLWTASCLEAGCCLQVFEEHCDRLLRALRELSCPVVIVNAEVGMGLVPISSEGRQFRDMAGIAGQKAAAIADSVVFMISGIPVAAKGELPFRKIPL